MHPVVVVVVVVVVFGFGFVLYVLCFVALLSLLFNTSASTSQVLQCRFLRGGLGVLHNRL